MSVDSWDTNSRILSTLSVQTFDDGMETDADCGPSSASSGLEHSLLLRRCDSRSSILADVHSSSDADINLEIAFQQIDTLPPSDDKQLMMEVYGKLPSVYFISA